MEIITATHARANFYRLIDQVTESHEPVCIIGKHKKAVLVSEEDWNSIQETMYLYSIPGMEESIKEGMVTPREDCTPLEKLEW